MPFPFYGLRFFFKALIITLPVGSSVIQKHQYRKNSETADQKHDILPLFFHSVANNKAHFNYQWKKSNECEQQNALFHKPILMLISIVVFPIQIPVYIRFQPS